MKRTPLKRRGRRAERERAALDEFRDAVLNRAYDGNGRYLCCRCEKHLHRHEIDPHHVVPRGRGGTHDPKNGVALCRACHSGVHDHTVKDWRSWLKSAWEVEEGADDGGQG